MNRAIPPQRDGSTVLRPGRIVRALLIVNGECTLEDLEAELVEAGFDPRRFLAADPDLWAKAEPGDWPEEPQEQIAVNECLVRIMGAFEARAPVGFGRDIAIGQTGASYTIAAAWEYAPAIGEKTGAAAPAPNKPAGAAAAAVKDSTTPLLLTAAGLFGLGFWMNYRAERRAEKEQARMLSAIQRDEREVLASRVAELEEEGHTRAEALAMAQSEIEPEAIAIMAIEEGA